MSWNGRLIDRSDLGPGAALGESVRALIAQQLSTWPMLAEAVEGLSGVRVRRLSIAGSTVVAQNNPRRIVSTTARVDSSSIGARPCFLCPENLPAEEKGIEFGDRFVVLCNPFPVLKDHLVVSAKDHIPQAISGRIGAMLDLAGQLGEGWFALYNGPKCGASAPDHLHFQACDAGGIPLFEELETWDRMPVHGPAGVEAYAPVGYRVKLLAAESRDRAALEAWFDKALEALASITGSAGEPLVNIAASSRNGNLLLVVFPRQKHRPDCFFAEGEAKLTVSPASIDLSGVLVLPEPAHFERISTADVAGIFAEVTLDDALFDRWIRRIGSR